MPIPTFIAPSTKTFLNIGRELVTGTPVVGTTTMPVEQNDYSPEDTPKFLPDEAIRGVMTPLFNEIRGPEDATFSFGGPVFFDNIGFWLDNTFGDMSTTGTTPSSATATSAPAVAGDTTLAVVTISGYSSGSIVQVDTGALSEVVVLSTAPSGSTLTFAASPLRFAHASSAAVAIVTGPYTHKYAILNTGSGQPPTHTLCDFTGLTATVGARAYPSACVSQLDFTGNTEQLLMYKVSGNSWLSAPAASTPTANTTFTVPQAAWESTVSIGGSPVNDIGEWQTSIKRKLEVYWTATNQQQPFIIARGGLTLTHGIKWTVAENETALTEMLASGPLAFSATVSNGLSGTALLSFNLTTTTAQTVKSKPGRSAVLVGYDNSAEAVANSTDAGGSGGIGPGTVTLINNIATY
jgi:hypothetical protein